MSPATWLLVGLAGGAGAVARSMISGAVAVRTRAPWLGTAVVNVAGAAALGLLLATLGGPDGRAVTDVAGVGFLGGFTTFSTWMVEAVTGDRGPDLRQAVRVVLVPLLLGVAAAWIGLHLT